MGVRSFSYSGLVVAGVGFGLTRFTVTFAVTESRMQFFFGGLFPLALGLSLAAAGVVLTVGRYRTSFVRTVTVWCLLGTSSMAVLVVLTLLGSEPMRLTDVETLRQETILSNFLIAGAAGGALTGVYAAKNRTQRREISQQANRLILLNRLLRDKVINAATAIKGHTSVLEQQHEKDSVETIARQADSVVDTVESVKYLTDDGNGTAVSGGSVAIDECVETAVAQVREEYPEATYTVNTGTGARALAGPQLEQLVRHLVRNAIEHNETSEPTVTVTVHATQDTITLSVRDNGPGLPGSQQALLETGEIAEFDDPTTGFGLNTVRLLSESFDGRLETDVDEDGTTVSLSLTRTDTARPGEQPGKPGVAPSRLSLAVGAGLVAGVTMAATMQLFGDIVDVIGALYGIQDPIVGLITHEFHSVVFALGYAGLLSVLPARYSERVTRCLAVAIVLSITLWAVAAGVVMPLWLDLVGLSGVLPIPNLTLGSFLGHLAWGVTTGTIYHVGDAWLVGRAQEPAGSSAVTT